MKTFTEIEVITMIKDAVDLSTIEMEMLKITDRLQMAKGISIFVNKLIGLIQPTKEVSNK